MQQTRKIGREIGTALAILAVYLLTILAPMHQARATQLEFSRLGYQTIETGWVLCTPQGAVDETGKLVVSKCPATGIGKQDLVPPVLYSAVVAIDRNALQSLRPLHVPTIQPLATRPPVGSRAPPIAV